MNILALDVATGSALVAALAYSAFAVHLLWTGRMRRLGSKPSMLFVGALIATALWGWFNVGASLSDGAWGMLVPLADLARYAAWFAFLLSVLQPVITEQRQQGIARLLPVAMVLVLVRLGALGAEALLTSGHREAARIALFTTLALPVTGLLLVEQLFRNVSDDSRWNAKPLCLALGIVFFFDIYVYSQAVLFGRADADAVDIRGAIHACAVPLLLIASKRRSDWIARLQISRAAAFHSTALVIAGSYLLIVAGTGYYIRYFGGEWGSALQLAALCVALAVGLALAFSGTMRSRLRVFVRKHFFSYSYDYREEWLRLTAMLSAKSSPAEMGALVIRGLADMVESPGGALWTHAPDQPDLVQTARWNAPALKDREATDASFAEFLRSTGWIVDLEVCRQHPERYAGLVPPSWLGPPRPFWLAIPLIVADELIGFVALTRPRTPVDLNWEVTDLLKTASRQAAGFLAQMQTTEALLETRKFDAFNRMSAFVVHDLKNIVTQLSLMLANAKRLHANPEFQQDMLATVENSLEKMRQLMLQLREGEAPPGGQSGVDLAKIVASVGAVAAARGRTIDIEVAEAVVTRGHEQRIERVLGHVVQNALDASGPGDRVWVKLSRRSGQALVEVGDTGAGMSQDYVQTRLFKPFQTTKPTGMGIGAYESFQYVRELGGSINVESELGRGTVMTIMLPLFESRQPSELQMAGAK